MVRGWLERFLVITALLLQSPATVGLILTAKSIARYPEFKSERFAEYFLIGTLLSISMARSVGRSSQSSFLARCEFQDKTQGNAGTSQTEDNHRFTSAKIFAWPLPRLFRALPTFAYIP